MATSAFDVELLETALEIELEPARLEVESENVPIIEADAVETVREVDDVLDPGSMFEELLKRVPKPVLEELRNPGYVAEEEYVLGVDVLMPRFVEEEEEEEERVAKADAMLDPGAVFARSLDDAEELNIKLELEAVLDARPALEPVLVESLALEKPVLIKVLGV